MVILSKSVDLSLAYRAGGPVLGGNWRVEMGGEDEADLDRWLAEVKSLLDHRCLFQDVPEFLGQSCGAQEVLPFLGQRYAQAKFITLHETERFSCTLSPEGRTCQVKANNLWLKLRSNETGFMTSCERVTQAVIDTLPEFRDGANGNEMQWGQTLLNRLRTKLPELVSVRIDLSGGRYIVVE